MSVYSRNNVHVCGTGPRTMVFAHGYGCDQNMWRYLVPAFEGDFRLILFDHVGAGKSDLAQYRPEKYRSLEGYASDLLEIIEAVGSVPVIFVGHSVSSMIGAVAANKRPSLFESLVLIGPSPCYMNDGDYSGGFNRSDIEALVATLDSNYLGWSSAMAPVIVGTPNRPELVAELNDSFCRTNPEIAKQFARVTFLSDHRADVSRVRTPSLLLQCSQDLIAPDSVGEFLHRQMPGSTLVKLRATGHCPHLSAPAETIAAIRKYLIQ